MTVATDGCRTAELRGTTDEVHLRLVDGNRSNLRIGLPVLFDILLCAGQQLWYSGVPDRLHAELRSVPEDAEPDAAMGRRGVQSILYADLCADYQYMLQSVPADAEFDAEMAGIALPIMLPIAERFLPKLLCADL